MTETGAGLAAVVMLLPDEDFTRRLLDCKARVRRRIGEQMYLDHPPHLSVYASVFPRTFDLNGFISEFADELTIPIIEVVGWHAFEADALTGLCTLVCDLSDESQWRLRAVQTRLVDALSPQRDSLASVQLFERGRANLSRTEWANVEGQGFPYLGTIWRPHFTVASAAPDDFSQMLDELQGCAPTGRVLCTKVAIDEITGGTVRRLSTTNLLLDQVTVHT